MCKKKCAFYLSVLSALSIQSFFCSIVAQPWYEISLEAEGIYKIDSVDLSEAGMNISTINPQYIRIFYGGGRELPQDMNVERPILREIPIHVEGENDGTFDPEDFLLFFGSALSGWDYDYGKDEYTCYQNHYTMTNVYWLTVHDSQPGLRMKTIDGTPVHTNPFRPSTFRTRIHEEKECYHPLHSGLDWYWQRFGDETARFDFDAPGAISDSTTIVKLNVKGDTRGEHSIKVHLNGHLIRDTCFYNTQPLHMKVSGKNWVQEGRNELSIEHSCSEEYGGQILLDWFEIEYWRRFEMDERELEFFAPHDEGIAEYRLTGHDGDDIHIFDVTDPYNVAKIENISPRDTMVFQDSLSSEGEKRYFVLSSLKFKNPLSIIEDHTSYLRSPSYGADYVIITHDEFYGEVLPLKYHREWGDGLSVEVVEISDIYDEFAWGLFDPTAIRDFLKYARENWSLPPSYALLVGDGHYDYKNNLLSSPDNRVPPYEDGKKCSDDWYVYLDDDRGIDMTIGRLPARSLEEVRTMVNKIIDYDNSPYFGPWRNTVLLLADDDRQLGEEVDWETVFTTDSEHLHNSFPVSFDCDKVYSIGYEMDEDLYKPEATTDLIGKINTGASIVNYVGHGLYEGLSHEKLFRISTHMDLIENTYKPFVFFAAACDVGMFDSPMDQCLAEEFLCLEHKGAVAVIAATRHTTAVPNYIFNSDFYRELFEQNDGMNRIGDITAAAKQSGSLYNNELYVLFGDPAQRLGLPQYEVEITSIVPDSLKALSHLTVEGEVRRDGSLWSDFNGSMYLRVFGCVDSITHTTSSGKEVQYVLPGPYLFRGTHEVRQGQFSATFLIPGNIRGGNATGRISAYTWNDRADAAGAVDAIWVGGQGSLAFTDTTGPEINLTVEEEYEHAPRQVTVNATLWDECGINLTGDTLHALTLWVDNDSLNHIDVTDFFEYETGSCTHGALSYRLDGLELGPHKVTMRAWDNVNNASQESTNITITSCEVTLDYLPNAFSLSQNYPNPFNLETTIDYQVPEKGRITLTIFNVLGQKIKTLVNRDHEPGHYSIQWDGTNDNGSEVASGVYFHQMKGNNFLESKKCVLMK